MQHSYKQGELLSKDTQEDSKKAATTQIDTIRMLHEAQGLFAPLDLESMTQSEAKKMIASLSIRKAFKYRIYPHKETESNYRRVLALGRDIFNAAIDERKSAWECTKREILKYIQRQPSGRMIVIDPIEQKDDESKRIPVRRAGYFNTDPIVSSTKDKKDNEDKKDKKARGRIATDPEIRAIKQKYGITFKSQSAQFTEIKHEFQEYGEFGDHIFREALMRVDLAFQGVYKGIRGYPRFKSLKRYHSFTTDGTWKLHLGNTKITATNPICPFPSDETWKSRPCYLEFTDIGKARVKLHRPIEGEIQTVTIKREGPEWYAIFSCIVPKTSRQAYTDEIIGIDMGIKRLAAFSTEETDGIENPRWYRSFEEKLAKAQKELSRKQKPRKRRENEKAHVTRRQKAARRVAKLHRKIARKRRDELHKNSRELADANKIYALEALQIDNMVKHPKPKQDENGRYLPNGAAAKGGLNKSILDAGWGMFRQMLAYKAEEAGRPIILVDPRNTSITCPACGHCDSKNRPSQEIFCCVECGFTANADYVGACNIATAGKKIIERLSAGISEQRPSQNTNEAGSASAFVSVTSPKRKKPRRAAESASIHHPSQGSLWSDP